MGAVLAVGSIFLLLWIKAKSTVVSAVASTAGAVGNARITGPADPTVSYDTKAPAQGDPIGNTHLSIADPVYNASGEIVALPYRASDPAYGGGIPALVGLTSDPNPAGSVGSGISAIDKLNAPGASAPIPGGVNRNIILQPRIPTVPTFRAQPVSQIRVAGVRAGDSGSGGLPVAPSSGVPNRAPVSPLRPTIAVEHTGAASIGMRLSAAPNQTPATPATKPSDAKSASATKTNITPQQLLRRYF